MPHDVPLDAAVGALRLLDPLAVEGDVDVGRIELHERVDGPEDPAGAVALQGRQQLEGEARAVLREGFVYDVCYVHALLGMILRTSSGSMPRRRA